MQHGMFRHVGLNEDRGPFGVDSRREPVDQQFPDVGRDLAGVFVIGGQRVPIRHKEETRMVVLKGFPIREGPQIITQVQASAGLHSA